MSQPTPGAESVRFIDADAARCLFDYATLVDGLEALHREPPCLLDDMLLEQPGDAGPRDGFLVRAAWQEGKGLGVKMASIFPGNDARGKPAVQAAYVLFDGVDGTPLALIDGTELTYRKTAADSALGSRYLARADCRRLLMVGAGAMAPHLIEAHVAVRPTIEKVALWNRSEARRDRLVAALRERFDIVAVEDLGAAVAEADVVCCATMANEPLIRGEWLRPGTHVDLVGAYTPSMREADDATMSRGRIFVDSRRTTVGEIGELIAPMQAGIIDESDVLADHYDLCQGRHPGRESAEEITVFKNGGGGHLDLMVARLFLEKHSSR